MGQFTEQLRAVLKKNYILKKRTRRVTVAEIGLPLYFLVVLTIVQRSVESATKTGTGDQWDPPTPLYPYNFSCPSKPCYPLVFAPSSDPATNDIMARFSSYGWQGDAPVIIPGQGTGDYVAQHYGQLWGFVNISNGRAVWQEDPSPFDVPFITLRLQSNGTSISANLQQSLSQAVIASRLANINTTRPAPVQYVSTQPFPAAVTASFNITEILWPIYFVLLFFPSFQSVLVFIGTEKEKKLREYMRMMGLKDAAYYASWIITQGVMCAISLFIFVALAYAVSTFRHSNPFLVYVFFILYALSLVSLAMLVTLFFDKAKTLAMTGSLFLMVMLGCGALCQYLLFPKPDLNAAKFFACLLSPVAFNRGISLLAQYEFNKTGWTFTTPDEPWSIPDVLGMVILDTFLYSLLAWYLGKILPSEFGVRRKWNFCCEKRFWMQVRGDCDRRHGVARHTPINDHHLEAGVEDHSRATTVSGTEEDGEPARIAVHIDALSKEFTTESMTSCKTKKVEVKAVDEMSLDIRAGEVLSLLGHNGAGKSTLIAMLTGLYMPTRGAAHVDGLSIAEDMEELRTIIGVCPQNNLLFDQMSPKEHLELYGALKGQDRLRVAQAMPGLLAKLDLSEDSEREVKDFSGGMKRKISLLIAMIGKPQVLILDEPSSGVDPYSRRKMWDIIEEQKSEGTTVILTTHSMEEADVLGDRIAIMDHGKLKQLGTSLALKNAFGIGYSMVIIKEDDFELAPVEKIVKKHIDGYKVTTDVGAELTIVLPLAAVTKFGAFFSEIEKYQENLGIASYGVSMTTLEEVFLKIVDEHPTEAGAASGAGAATEGAATAGGAGTGAEDSSVAPSAAASPKSSIRSPVSARGSLRSTTSYTTHEDESDSDNTAGPSKRRS